VSAMFPMFLMLQYMRHCGPRSAGVVTMPAARAARTRPSSSIMRAAAGMALTAGWCSGCTATWHWCAGGARGVSGWVLVWAGMRQEEKVVDLLAETAMGSDP
jgi:hypothetical protein